MPTECTPESFDFGTAEGRKIIAAFDGGTVTSDAGVLLLGAADKAIGLIERLAACFQDHRRADLVEHLLPTHVTWRKPVERFAPMNECKIPIARRLFRWPHARTRGGER